MTNKVHVNIKQNLLWFLYFLLTISFSQGQTNNSIQSSLADTSYNFRQGRLCNGFSYYIKNIKDSKEVYSNLYVKVGYYNETDEEREFSHMLEHLAFKTNKSNSKNIIQHFNNYGISSSATTGTNMTNFRLISSSNNLDTLKRGIGWFRDLFDMNLNTNIITKEKEVIKQEVLFRSGINLNEYYLKMNVLGNLFPCIEAFKNHSSFNDHINGFKTSKLIDYYKKWYHPERASIVIAGDINNIDKLENYIRTLFTEIPRQKNKSWGEVKDCRLQYFQGPNKFTSLINKQYKNAHLQNKEVTLNLLYRDKDFQKYSKEESKKHLWTVINYMLAKRIQMNQMDGIYTLPPSNSKPYFNVVISDSKGTELQKLEDFIKLIKQIKDHGFFIDEVNEAQSHLKYYNTDLIQFWIKGVENFLIEKNNESSEYYDNNNRKEILFSVKEINDFVKQYLPIIPNDIGLTAPDENKALSYSELEIRKRITNASEKSVPPFLIPQEKVLLTINEIKNLKQIEYYSKGLNRIGIEELILNNGIRVLLYKNKSKGFYKNQIRISGYSSKGALNTHEEDYYSAINAPLLIKTAGIGNLTGKDLQSLQFINNLSLNLYINPLETGIKISGPRESFHKMTQLIFLSFTRPNKPNYIHFENWKSIERSRYMKPYRDTRFLDFRAKISEVINNKSIILKHGSTKRFQGIEQTNKDRAYEIYRQFFGNAKNFTFIVYGDFSREYIIPIIQKYIGNLPVKDVHKNLNEFSPNSPVIRKEIQRPFHIKFNTNYRNVTYSNQDNTYYMLYFISKVKNIQNWKEQIKLSVLGRLLNKKITELRYSRNAALYNFSASGTFDKHIKSYKVGVFLDCTKNELSWLQEEILLIIDEMKEIGLNSNDFSLVKQEMIKMLEKDINRTTIGGPKEVYETYINGEKLALKKKKLNFVKSLTIEDCQAAAKKYLIEENKMEFVM